MDNYEDFANCIIDSYGFQSNTVRGFSCYIPDTFVPSQGVLIWNYSRSYKRFETQIQKLFTTPRVNRMEDQDVSPSTYLENIEEAAIEYLAKLKETGVFSIIGNGLMTPRNKRIFNLGARFSKISIEKLAEIEDAFVNNAIIKYISSLIVDGEPYFTIKQPKQTCFQKLYSNLL